MARRKPQLDDVSDSDYSSSDGLHDDSLNGQPSRKRRRRTKEDAIYGIFADADPEADRARVRDGKKINYRAGQAFVPASMAASSSKVTLEDESDAESISAEDQDENGRADKMNEEEEQPEEDEGEDSFNPASFISSRGGIGSKSQREPRETPPKPKPKLGGRAGIGARAGIGSSSSDKTDETGGKRKTALTSLSTFVSAGSAKPSDTTVPPHPSTSAPPPPGPPPPGPPPVPPPSVLQEAELKSAGLPSAFSTPKPAVAPSTTFAPRPRPPPPPPATAIKFGSKFDPSAYLASMGWTGGGLGKTGQGIVAPIEVQLRPERAGIAYGGLKEKTKQAKDEARRKGEPVSSDEDAKRKPKPLKKETKAWTKPEKKPRKPKIEHRTYAQIIEEIGSSGVQHATVEKVFDARSGELREVGDLGAALGRKGTSGEGRMLPELRHNLRLICETNAQTLAALAREGVTIRDRERWLRREREAAERKRTAELEQIVRIRKVLLVVKELEELSNAALEEGGLEAFNPTIEKIRSEHGGEIVEFGLDEALVGAIVPLLRQLWSSSWSPLKHPTLALSYLTAWQPVLRPRLKPSGAMTAYDALLWHLWLPPIRSSLNNSWKPHRPSSAVVLLESWQPLLPPFVWDNLLDQVLLPKLKAGIAAWDEKRSTWGLEHVLFPWLPVLGMERMQEVVQEGKRRLRSGLKVWDVSKGPGEGLGQWKKLYGSGEGGGGEWDALMLSSVVPRLTSFLRKELRIEPAEQSMEALKAVLKWNKVVRRSMLIRVVAAEFFPKWLSTLHTWLKQPTADLNEVAEWYGFWRTWFVQARLVDDDDPTSVPNTGFCAGLDLINSALDMPPSEREKLKAPSWTMPTTASRHGAQEKLKEATAEVEVERATFKDVLAEELAAHDMFLFKTSQVQPTGPMSTVTVWRVSKSFNAGGGAKAVLIYVDDDVVFLQQGEVWEPVSIGTLVAALSQS